MEAQCISTRKERERLCKSISTPYLFIIWGQNFPSFSQLFFFLMLCLEVFSSPRHARGRETSELSHLCLMPAPTVSGECTVLFVCCGDSHDSSTHMWAQWVFEGTSQAFVHMDMDPLAVFLSKDCGNIRSFISEQRWRANKLTYILTSCCGH